VTLIIDSASGDPRALDARIVGYIYRPLMSANGYPAGRTILLAEEVCHYAPIPDPSARYRGMSWLTPILEDIHADKAATRHKSRFFVNGANPNFAVIFDKDTSEDDFTEFTTLFREAHQGAENAYRTGAGDLTEVLRARIAELDARLDHHGILLDLQRVRAELLYLSGDSR
jgi:hypothetical protein